MSDTIIDRIEYRGINSYYGSGDIIRNNIVHNISASDDWGSTGILLSGGGSGGMVIKYITIWFMIFRALNSGR